MWGRGEASHLSSGSRSTLLTFGSWQPLTLIMWQLVRIKNSLHFLNKYPFMGKWWGPEVCWLSKKRKWLVWRKICLRSGNKKYTLPRWRTAPSGRGPFTCTIHVTHWEQHFSQSMLGPWVLWILIKSHHCGSCHSEKPPGVHRSQSLWCFSGSSKAIQADRHQPYKQTPAHTAGRIQAKWSEGPFVESQTNNE